MVVADANALALGTVRAAIQALRPYLEEEDPELVERIDERTKALETLLAKHQRGDGWAPYTDLSTDEVKALSKALDALSEEVAKVAGVVGTR